MSAIERFDLGQHGVRLDHLSWLDMQRLDDARDGRFQLVLHLHRFEDEHDVTRSDLVSFGDQHTHDGAWHNGL